LYIGLKVHNQDRGKESVMALHQLGISVSYGRVQEVRNGIAGTLTERWEKDGVVIPTGVKKATFVTGAVDNIDESGKVDFHGTAIYLSQATSQKKTVD
jgi:hypothetical protein